MASTEVKQEFSWLRRISTHFISEKDFDKIEKSSVKLSFKKGETILKQGGLSTHIAYVEKGIVKFNYQNEINKNLILTIVSAPKILGGANLFYKDNNLFSFIAVEDCEVVLIDSSVLLSVMTENAKFSIMLFQVATEMFKKAVMNFISLAYKQKEGRIADIIIYLSTEVYHKNKFMLSLTRKELAEFAGCSTENVIMTLSKWQTEKLIILDGKQVEITDLEKLKHISKIG
jgi:CRP/FNR family transcriptional regulator, polysaccharide utilization system transcription regulator